ncbi:MAG: hypothetical protein HYX24_05465 [Candidatus Aenigmarchaeota archaeon]|nr:hypothetical protein [Candidatus Aenigmarchaeota archaeon]
MKKSPNEGIYKKYFYNKNQQASILLAILAIILFLLGHTILAIISGILMVIFEYRANKDMKKALKRS